MSRLPPNTSLRPFTGHVEPQGTGETWVLQRRIDFGDLTIRGSLWFLRLLCLGLVVLLGFAVATRPLTFGRVVFAIACLPVLWGLWHVLGIGLQRDGVTRVSLASDGSVSVWRRDRPQQLEFRCTPTAVLQARACHMSAGKYGISRWIDLWLAPDEQSEAVYLGFLGLSRVSAVGVTLAEDEAMWTAARALAEHLGVGFEASARGQ